MERAERIAFWVAVVSGGLGFLTSAGCIGLPEITPRALVALHPALLALGALAGVVALRRGRQIDRRRWRIVEDPDLTSGEREYAHKDAERRRRFAATSLLAAPLMLGYWLAYQVGSPERVWWAHTLPVSAVLGAVAGMIGERLSRRGDEGEQLK